MTRVSLLLLFLALACDAPKSISSIPEKIISADSLTPFHLIFYSGDERIEKFEINVYHKGGRYFAENISPLFYVGSTVDSNWAVGLNDEKIKICKNFIDKAKTLPSKCDESLSTSVSRYEIAMGRDTISINGKCDWGGLDFFKLREILFQEQFSQLESKRKAKIKSLNSKVNGKWYFTSKSIALTKNRYFILTRGKTSSSNCSWEFSNDNSFKNFCNGKPDLTHSNVYKWDIDEGSVFLEIEGGLIKDNAGNSYVANDGATFILDVLGDSVLKLKYVW